MDVDREHRARLTAFARLEELEAVYGDAIPARALRQGFFFEGHWVPLSAQQGIWRPRNPVRLEVPISIRTAASDPYGDAATEGGFWSYAYRSRGLTEAQAQGHADNEGLRIARELQLPLVYLHEIAGHEYQAFWPAWVVADDPEHLRFTVAIGDHEAAASGDELLSPRDVVELRYATRQAKVRLHQRHFRHVVIRAYSVTCAVCRLKNHRELLDAAHIRGDRLEGPPVVRNGLALCKIHHAAYDANVVGIRPDYVVEVSEKVLREIDGPMLRHGLQGLHSSALHVPRRPADRPDRDLLEGRYEAFRAAS